MLLWLHAEAIEIKVAEGVVEAARTESHIIHWLLLLSEIIVIEHVLIEEVRRLNIRGRRVDNGLTLGRW